MPKTAGMTRNATAARQVGHYCRKSQSTHYSSGQALRGPPLFISYEEACVWAALWATRPAARARPLCPHASLISATRQAGRFYRGGQWGRTIPIGPGTRTGDSHRRRHKQAFLQGRAGSRSATSQSIHSPPLGRTSRDKEHKFALSRNGQLAIDAAHMSAHGTF